MSILAYKKTITVILIDIRKEIRHSVQKRKEIVNKTDRCYRKRLTLDIPEEIFTRLKILTVTRNCTMVKWVTRLIVESIRKEEKYDKDSP